MSEAERREFLARTRPAAAAMGASTECRPERTAANWTKVGDPATGYRDIACRYTRVERPGAPFDRSLDCRGPDGKLAATIISTGTLTPVDYEMRVETRGERSTNVVIERGKWVGTCDSAKRARP